MSKKVLIYILQTKIKLETVKIMTGNVTRKLTGLICVQMTGTTSLNTIHEIAFIDY